MNTKQLKYVHVLAREGSFSRAAEELNISQPSLSQYIKKIEDTIGLKLFERTNGNVRLTDAGRVYLDTGRQILDLEHRMDMQFADIASQKTGSLIVGTAPYRAVSLMPAVAQRFRELYPGMHLVIREGTTAELTEGLEHGEYDLCVTLLPIDERQFSYEPVAEEELILASPGDAAPLPAEEAPDRRYPAIRPEAIDGQRMVMLTDAQYMQKQLENLAADYHLTLSPAAVVKSLEAQIAMVRAGIGTALMSTGIERFCAPGEVRFYSFVPDLPKRELVVSWKKERQLTRVAQELKNAIRDMAW